jgi:hypothetical protein
MTDPTTLAAQTRELAETLTRIVDWESVGAAATFSEAAYTHIEPALTAADAVGYARGKAEADAAWKPLVEKAGSDLTNFFLERNDKEREAAYQRGKADGRREERAGILAEADRAERLGDTLIQFEAWLRQRAEEPGR